MEFDKSRMYTMVNADEVKLGSKGYFADDLYSLHQAVQYEYKEYFGKVEHIKDDSTGFRFINKNKNGTSFILFYLVEEPAEKKLRPFRNTDELFTEWAKCYGRLPIALIDTPVIYLRHKLSDTSVLITSYGMDNICTSLDNTFIDMNDAFDKFTFNDYSPCGIEE